MLYVIPKKFSTQSSCNKGLHHFIGKNNMSIIVLSSSTSPITRSRCARYAYQRYWNRRKVFEIPRFPCSERPCEVWRWKNNATTTRTPFASITTEILSARSLISLLSLSHRSTVFSLSFLYLAFSSACSFPSRHPLVKILLHASMSSDLAQRGTMQTRNALWIKLTRQPDDVDDGCVRWYLN